MIHVPEQPEPAMFDATVRSKGLANLLKRNIPLAQLLPPKTKLQPYWRGACLDDLYRSYAGVCAYLGVHFERVTGAGSVDHFVAKSARADLAYEWSNYRLACSIMNSRKRAYDDVLDPFTIKDGWFHLEPVSGRIYPNPTMPQARQNDVSATIERLKLDNGGNREIRARHLQDFIDGKYESDFLRERSPFVWMEARRQMLL